MRPAYLISLSRTHGSAPNAAQFHTSPLAPTQASRRVGGWVYRNPFYEVCLLLSSIPDPRIVAQIVMLDFEESASILGEKALGVAQGLTVAGLAAHRVEYPGSPVGLGIGPLKLVTHTFWRGLYSV